MDELRRKLGYTYRSYVFFLALFAGLLAGAAGNSVAEHGLPQSPDPKVRRIELPEFDSTAAPSPQTPDWLKGLRQDACQRHAGLCG